MAFFIIHKVVERKVWKHSQTASKEAMFPLNYYESNYKDTGKYD
jgi:hypothetical protein